MTTYALPGTWKPNSFEMRVVSNQRTFTSAFNPASTQVVDLGGDYWCCVMAVPVGVSDAEGASREAFIDRLRGAQNFVSLCHQKRPVPRGTMRDGAAAGWSTSAPAAATWSTVLLATATWTAGDPALKSDVAQFATTATLTCTPARTLLAGDHIGLPNGQTVRVLADATANGSGDMAIEFAPSARSSMSAYGHVTWDRPTVEFRLRDGGQVPVQWRPGLFDSITLDLVEAL